MPSPAPGQAAQPPDARRICFVVEKLADRSGGAERVLIETANALAASGYMVEILTHEHRGKPPFYPLAFGVTHTNLRRPKAVRGPLRRKLDQWRERAHQIRNIPAPFDRLIWFSKHGAFWRRLERHLALHQPAAVIAFLPPAISALALAQPGYPLRRIASTHNAPEQDFHNPERWDPSALDRRRRWALMPRMDLIMVLLPEYRDWYPANLRDKVVVVPNAVRPIPETQRDGCRKPWVISIGRLATVKRHELLLDAWAQLAPEFPNWRLRIFGQGPLEAHLKARIKTLNIGDQARLMGHTQEIEQEYLQSAILAHPAEFEGFPLAVTEALAAGLPVVGFEDCSGLNRLVVPGVNGLLVPSTGSRLEALTQALRSLMQDEPCRRQLGQAGPETMHPYGPEAVTALWVKCLTEHPNTTLKPPHGSLLPQANTGSPAYHETRAREAVSN